MKSQKTFLHWVLRTKHGFQPLLNRDACVELWKILQHVFPKPQTLAAILMPNHAHWITINMEHIAQLKYKLRKQIIPFEDRWNCAFEVQPNPTTLPDHHHLQRNVRYIHLNPCRANLVSDPLLWEWSTHWDYLGLIHDSWIDRKSAFQSMNRTYDLEGFHKYVSSDPKTSLIGTPFFKRSISSRSTGPEDMLSAILFRHRSSNQTLYRKQKIRTLAILTASDLSIPIPKLAKLLRISPQAAYRHLKRNSQKDTAIEIIKLLNQDQRGLTLLRSINL